MTRWSCQAALTFVSAFLICVGTGRLPAAEPQATGQLFDEAIAVPASLKTPDGKWLLVDYLPATAPAPKPGALQIGVIDSGILADHPQLRGLVRATRDFTGEGIRDRIGHGTVVAILTQPAPEVLRKLKIEDPVAFPLLIAKVAHADRTVQKDDLMLAIDWIVKQGASVVNLSLGFKESEGDFSDLCAMIANKKDTLFVAAAGNYGPNVAVYPAACQSDNLICVSALHPSGLPAAYSGRCASNGASALGTVNFRTEP
jgi:subtilisin family serine protease